MNISEMKVSKYLKREDVGKGALCTIDGDVYQENMAKEGEPQDLKWCLRFAELDKGMVLNVVNQQSLAEILGDETSKWAGNKVVLFDDPNVMYSGKRVGGIRIRAHRVAAAAPTRAATKPAPAKADADLADDESSNDVGF